MISVSVWLVSFRVGELMVVDEVLDFVLEAGVIIGVMAFLLVELAILVKVKVVRYWVW